MSTNDQRPNVLFVTADQLAVDGIGAQGCPDVKTPNMDRLIREGVTFTQSYSTNPLCSPARSSLFTGRMTVETSVIGNSGGIDERLPTLGHVFADAGYDSVFCGKTHMPYIFDSNFPGFRVLPSGVAKGHQASLSDPIVSRNCEAYLRNRDKSKPFFLAASYSHPHDICSIQQEHTGLLPEEIPFQDIWDDPPTLAPNHNVRVPAPASIERSKFRDFSDDRWRYYNYIYCRMVEMFDAELGRLLDALEDTDEWENTIVLLSSDHGDGRGRHGLVSKWDAYEAAAAVPFIVSWTGHIQGGQRDDEHLVSGLDVMPTLCDLAGVEPAPTIQARSVRPLMEGKAAEWRDYLVMEMQTTGRAVRTEQYKYVDYPDDPQKQLFDMQADPWELENLYGREEYDEVVREHRRLIDEWEAQLEPSARLEGMVGREL